ncbi:MAG: hypothetical protein ABIR57_04975, partial [Aeromicrobium sp.]
GATLTTPTLDLVSITSTVLNGAVWKRTMIHVKSPNFLIVDDQVTQKDSKKVVQRWNVGADRTVKTGSGRAWTLGTGTNSVFLWAGGIPTVTTVKGQKDPLLGWRSETQTQFIPTPIVQGSRTGTSVRLTAIIVPYPAEVDPNSIKVLRSWTQPTSRLVDIAIGENAYRVIFASDSATFEPIDAPTVTVN